MLLLIIYVLIALVFSFLCSIAEAVLLSVNSAYISVLEELPASFAEVDTVEQQPAGPE